MLLEYLKNLNQISSWSCDPFSKTASDSASQLNPGMYEDNQIQDGNGERRGDAQHFLTDPSMVRKQSD